MTDLIIYALMLVAAVVVVRWAIRELRALPSYVGLLGRSWHVGFRAACGLILLFLIAPILVIIPLSFNSEPYFTYPLPGVSLRWYEDFLASRNQEQRDRRGVRDPACHQPGDGGGGGAE